MCDEKNDDVSISDMWNALDNMSFSPKKTIKVSLVNPQYLEDLEKKVEFATIELKKIIKAKTIKQVRQQARWALANINPEGLPESGEEI